MAAQAHKREVVGSRLRCLSVRAGGSCPLGHLEGNSLTGRDGLSPLCVVCLRSWLLSDRSDLSSQG